MSKDSKYKYCIVATCTITSIKCSDKRFATAPSDSKRKQIWFKAAKRDE